MSMKQLSGMDATFLYMETPETPMHVAGLTLYELPAGFKGTFHAHFKKFFAGRVHLIPIFGKKLAKSVFQLDHPGWVDAGDLNLDDHIKGAVLPKPGTWKQLEDFVGDLHAQRLDRTRPLWEFTVIEGLESGQVALYSKVHHAAVDGGAGMVITKALYDVSPIPREVEPPAPKLEERKPTTPERAIMGLHDMAASLMRQQIRLMEGVPKMAGQVADLVAPVLSGTLSLPQILAPKTPFNGTIGAARSYSARSVSLSDAKAMCKASDTKINDMVMAICAGALRRYLDEKHVLPDAPLTAFVPISMREVGNTDINNQVFGMNCVLATNYSDPVKRLKKINAESRSSKTIAGGVKDAAPNDFTLLGAPMLLPGLMSLFGRTRLADILPNTVNVTISNTQGPPFPLYCAGAKVTALYPVSIPIHGVGLNFTVQSYLDKLDFGVTADAASVPDVDHVGDLLLASFAELRAALLGAPKDAVAAPEAPKPAAIEKQASKKAAPKKAAAKPAPEPTAKPAPRPRARPAPAKPPAKPAAKATTAEPAAKAPADKPSDTPSTPPKAPAKRKPPVRAARPKPAPKPAPKPKS